MQPVRKKNSKNRGAIAAIGLLVLGAAIGILYVLTRPDAEPLSLPHQPHEDIVLIDRKAEDLLRFEVTSGRGDRFAIVYADGDYGVEGCPEFPLNRLELDLMIKDLTTLHANEEAGRVKTDEENLAMLGLGRNAPRVTATYQDGSRITLVFGNSSQEEIPADYLMVLGSDMVYTISPETRDHFDRTLASLHLVPSINFNSELVDAVEFTGQDGFRVGQLEGLFEIIEPFRYPVSPNAAADLLNTVGKMRFALYYGDATMEVLQETGLESPKRTITFHLSQSTITDYDEQDRPSATQIIPAQQLIISIGDNIDNIGLYCLYEGKIYQASNASMGFLRDTGLYDLLSDSPVNLPINRLQSLEVTQGGETTSYQIEMIEQITANNQIATDSNGNIIFEPYITSGDQEIPSEPFLREYLRLMNLKRSGRLPEGFKIDGSPPVRQYVLRAEDGVRELALFDYDALHYAMRVNGVFIDYISKALADQVAL